MASEFTLLMLGTGAFAVPTFRRLLDDGYRVAALVTRPPRPVHGKKEKESLSPMRALAEERGLSVLAPEDVNADEARTELRSLRPTCWWCATTGRFLAPATLAVARLGGINLHASLLPKYRGAAPINWAMYHGERETGVTVIHMTPQLDAGPSIGQAKTVIDPDETAVELEARLSELGAPLVLQVDRTFASGQGRADSAGRNSGDAGPPAQKDRRARRLVAVGRRFAIRFCAFQPWPATYTFWHRPDGQPLRLILDRVSIAPGAEQGDPGMVLEASGGRLLVATGDGALSLDRVQPAGKRILPTAEFLRGYPVQRGQRFGKEN